MDDLYLLLFFIGGIFIWRQQVRLGRLERQLATQGPAEKPDEASADALIGEPETVFADEQAPEPKPETAEKRPDEEKPRSSLEQQLTQHWFVWLGGIVLALGALFLVRAAAESGLLGPSVRLALAALGGLAAIIAAEVVTARTAKDRLNPLVPAALAAAGVAALYAAIWASYELYDQISAALAFAGLAGVAFLAMALAMRHGAFLAWLGVGGGLAVPILAGSESGDLRILMIYLAAVFTAAFAILRVRTWSAFAWALVPAAIVWPAIILLQASFQPAADSHVLAAPLGWLLAYVGVLALALPRPGVGGRPWPASLQAALALMWLAWIHAIAPLSPLWPLALGITATIAVVRVRQWHRIAVIMLPLAGLLALLTTDLGQVDWQAFGNATTQPDQWNVAHALLRPSNLGGFQTLAMALAGVTGLAALVAVLGARWPGFWATVAIAAPLLVLAVSYLRLGGIADLARLLAFLALGTSLAATALATWLNRQGLPFKGAVGAFVLGAIAGLALAAGMILEHGWLPLALALITLASVLLWHRLRLRALLLAAPWLAWVAALVALALPAASGLWHSTMSIDLLAAFLGAGVPAALVWLAASRTPQRVPAVADRLRLASFLLAILFIGRLAAWFADGSALVEAGLQTAYWTTVIAWAVHFARRRRIFFGITVATHSALIVLLSLPVLIETSNPLLVAFPVGNLPVLNQLLPGYGLPALAGALLTTALAVARWRLATLLIGAISLGLFLFYVGLEIRRAFGGPVLTGPTLQGELYAYSLLLLVTAAGLLTAGLLRNLPPLRWAGVAVLATAVAKLFLLDLAHLDGLLRAAAFLGVGLGLIAVGYASRRWQRA